MIKCQKCRENIQEPTLRPGHVWRFFDIDYLEHKIVIDLTDVRIRGKGSTAEDAFQDAMRQLEGHFRLK